ncbi:MAG: RIP metalloprotease RseP [Burkholderiales bacterium]|nr:RIP metalloprotease RseP [Burkholderiales bacterium]MDE2452516.1 RIP metalloprotease RseP [Burkholderiales bacterium]
MIVTILAFVFTLGVLIVVHEYGHYRVAVACGVKVLRFSVGFGRVLWRRQPAGPDGTEFVVAALPLGGYVKMLDEREAPVEAHELDRAFNRQPLWRRAAIVAAGPIANLLLAVLLLAAASWIGIDEPRPILAQPVAGSLAERAGLRAGDWVQAVSNDGDRWHELRSMSDLRWQLAQAALHGQDLQLQVTDRSGHGLRSLGLDLSRLGAAAADAPSMQAIGISGVYSEPRVGEVKPGGPAAAAGLMNGDRVLAVDGKEVGDARQLVGLVRAGVAQGAGQLQHWSIERAGKALALDVQPRVVTEAGQAVGKIDAVVGQAPAMVLVRSGLVEGLERGARRTWELSSLTVEMIGRMVIGQASLKNLSGPLTIADYAGQSVHQGLAYYLGFLGLVSVSLGVLNLLPLPMLDGGHLMYYIFEAFTGRPVSDLWLARLQRGGIALLLAMMSVALFNDVVRLLGLH